MATPIQAVKDSVLNKNLILVVGVFTAIIVLGVISYQFFPKTGGITGTAKPNPNMDYLTAKAKECQGEFARLSPDDQQKVDQLSKGRGKMAMFLAWKSMQTATRKKG